MPSGEVLFPLEGTTPAKTFFVAIFNALRDAPRNGRGIDWSRCKVTGRWLENLLNETAQLPLSSVSPFQQAADVDQETRNKVRSIGSIMYKTAIVESKVDSVDGRVIPRDEFSRLKDFEMDHEGKKKFMLCNLGNQLYRLLDMGEEGLEELLEEFRICDCKWHGNHDHSPTREYAVNPLSRNLLAYNPLPGSMTPRQIIETYEPFQAFVGFMYHGFADSGRMPFEYIACKLFHELGFYIGDCFDGSKDDFNRPTTTQKQRSSFVGQIIDKSLKRLFDTSHLGSFQLQNIHMDHQGEKKMNPGEARSRSIPTQLRELAKCIPKEVWKHDNVSRNETLSPVNIDWLFTGGARMEDVRCVKD